MINDIVHRSRDGRPACGARGLIVALGDKTVSWREFGSPCRRCGPA